MNNQTGQENLTNKNLRKSLRLADASFVNYDDAIAKLSYSLESDTEDYIQSYSRIRFYRCNSKRELLVSDSDSIQTDIHDLTRSMYLLRIGDIGCTLKAVITPKAIGYEDGEDAVVDSSYVITENDIEGEGLEKYYLDSEFEHFPIYFQRELLANTFTVDRLHSDDDKLPFRYGAYECKGTNEYGLITEGLNSLLLYTSDDTWFDFMSIELTFTYFTSNHQLDDYQMFHNQSEHYMEIYIRYNTNTRTGYGIRISMNNSDYKKIDFVLMRYDNGIASPISSSVTSDLFFNHFRLKLCIEGTKLNFYAIPSSSAFKEYHNTGFDGKVELNAEVENTGFGGYGLYYTGNASKSSHLIYRRIVVSYEPKQ